MTFDIPMNRWAVLAGVAGSLFIGYCIYFDRKRRSAPDFKVKLRQKRQEKRAQLPIGAAGNIVFPTNANPKSVQQFFVDCIALSEHLTMSGRFEEAGDYLAAAIAVIGEPNYMMQSLKTNVPKEVYDAVVRYLPLRRAQAEELQVIYPQDPLLRAAMSEPDDVPIE